MKVLFLPDYSAANAYQRALATGLRELGVDVRADPTGSRRLLPIAEALRRHGRPDVIHLHWTEPYIPGGSSRVSRVKARRTLLELRVAKRAGMGLVWTAHDLFRHDRRRWPLLQRPELQSHQHRGPGQAQTGGRPADGRRFQAEKHGCDAPGP